MVTSGGPEDRKADRWLAGFATSDFPAGWRGLVESARSGGRPGGAGGPARTGRAGLRDGVRPAHRGRSGRLRCEYSRRPWSRNPGPPSSWRLRPCAGLSRARPGRSAPGIATGDLRQLRRLLIAPRADDVSPPRSHEAGAVASTSEHSEPASASWASAWPCALLRTSGRGAPGRECLEPAHHVGQARQRRVGALRERCHAQGAARAPRTAWPAGSTLKICSQVGVAAQLGVQHAGQQLEHGARPHPRARSSSDSHSVSMTHPSFQLTRQPRRHYRFVVALSQLRESRHGARPPGESDLAGPASFRRAVRYSRSATALLCSVSREL